MQTNGATYYMKYSIGTPPFEVVGYADTGSDLIWTQCQPCIRSPNVGNNTSKIVLGEDAVVSGAEVVRTPLATNSFVYRITLEALSVGDQKRIEFEKQEDVTEGNVRIDSGTTFTFLPPALYNGLVSALDKTIRHPKVADPHGVLKHCYEIGEPDKIVFPFITAHFKGGDVKLKAINTFYWVADHVVCLSMLPGEEGFFGNIAQLNFWVGYDLQAGTVSFKPADCSL
ncbi:probable aspartic protease At2g35615 [Vigna unguiculata]|uniref:probable aspartic protease At2g35615 n=1 Tax=Vigna unguiculata TaxID=3917 RepID=UPI001016F192|nr:probable aspartic protease At2g35615 [Vigna unguiculata]